MRDLKPFEGIAVAIIFFTGGWVSGYSYSLHQVEERHAQEIRDVWKFWEHKLNGHDEREMEKWKGTETEIQK